MASRDCDEPMSSADSTDSQSSLKDAMFGMFNFLNNLPGILRYTCQTLGHKPTQDNFVSVVTSPSCDIQAFEGIINALRQEIEELLLRINCPLPTEELEAKKLAKRYLRKNPDWKKIGRSRILKQYRESYQRALVGLRAFLNVPHESQAYMVEKIKNPRNTVGPVFGSSSTRVCCILGSQKTLGDLPLLLAAMSELIAAVRGSLPMDTSIPGQAKKESANDKSFQLKSSPKRRAVLIKKILADAGGDDFFEDATLAELAEYFLKAMSSGRRHCSLTELCHAFDLNAPEMEALLVTFGAKLTTIGLIPEKGKYEDDEIYRLLIKNKDS